MPEPDAAENMAEIKNEELREEIEKILKEADLSSITSKGVRQKLEKKYGRSLTKQKAAIDEIVLNLVNAMSSSEGGSGGSGEDSDVENKKESPKKETKKEPKKEPTTKEPKKEATSDEEDENDEEEEVTRPKRKAAPRSTRAKRSRKGSDDDGEKKPKKKGGRGKGSGYTRACKLSPALAELMGEETMPRHEVVKRMWALIKEKKLYDPSNKQFAICDEALYKVIGTKRFRAFSMMKYLKSHFLYD